MAENEDFKSSDERIGDMFRSTIAPLPDPDEAFVNRALLARNAAPAAASAAVSQDSQPWYKRMAQDAAESEMRSGKAAEATLSRMPTEDKDSAALQTRIQGENRPIQSRDPKGDVLPEYKPSVGRKILRGMAGAGRGLLEGGVAGAVGGAIDPRSTYGQNDPRRQYAGYGDPNREYQTAETNRQRDLAADTQSLDISQKRFKEASDRLKGVAQEQRATATTFKDAGTTATTAEERATQEKKEQNDETRLQNESQRLKDEDELKKTPKTVDEMALARSKAAAAGDKPTVAIYDGALKEIERIKQAERVPRDTTAADIAKAIQVAQHRTTETLKIDGQKEAERNRRYAELDKNLTLKYDQAKMGAEKQKVDADLEQKYQGKYQDVNDEADKMLGLTKAGAPLKKGGGDKSAPTPQKNAPKDQDLGPAPTGSKEGRTGKLKDGTPVVVRKGRLVKNG